MLKGRKLLIASLGVAAVSYACTKAPERTGNLMPPQPEPDAGAPTAVPSAAPPEMTGNLVAPMPQPEPEPSGKPVKKVGK